MNAAETSRDLCPSCGVRLPDKASSGQCTSCLLRLGLQLEAENAIGEADGHHDVTTSVTLLATAPTSPGRFGDYELLEAIGRGAMGVVFKARQRSLDRLVALKVLDLAEQLPMDAAKRFRIEASAAAALRHPCIVTIHEVGVHQGRHYLAMDLVEGPTLATLVAQQPLPAVRAARLIAAVAEAIQCAHEHGILHRDLKPTNILVDAADQPRVADFGLAKRMHADANMTMPGHIMGSPNYMSPEQARCAVLGPPSDVHALGAVLYHCLSGRPPFVGQTVPDTLHHVIHGEPVPLRLVVAGTPRDLDTITLKCLQKDPAKRYPDARSLADDLRRFLRGEPISARPAGRAERMWRWCRRRPAVAGLSAATALLLVAVTAGSLIAALRIRAERERAEDHLYVAEMNVAQQLIETSGGQARRLLERHRPAPGENDRRGFEWRYLWSQSGDDERELFREPTSMRHIIPLPGGKLIAVGNAVWEMGSSSHRVFTAPTRGQVVMAFDPLTSTVIYGGPDGLGSWSTVSGEFRRLPMSEGVNVAALSLDGQSLATGGTKQLIVWKREGDTWRQRSAIPFSFHPHHNAQTLAFSPDGSYLVSGTGRAWSNSLLLTFWSVPELKPRPGLMDAPGDILSLAFTPDGTRLVTGTWNDRIRVWDLSTMSEISSTMRHPGVIRVVTFSPYDPDIFATASSDRKIRLWNLRSGEELVALQGLMNTPNALRFAPVGNALFTAEGDGGRIAAWDGAIRRRSGTLIAGGRSTLPLGFSPSGETLATIDDTGALRYWDVEHQREEKEQMKIDLKGVHTDFDIIAPGISANLETLAIGMEDGRVQLWHLPTATQHIIDAHKVRMRNVAFSPVDSTLATLADDSILKLWNVRTRALLSETTVPGKLAGIAYNAPLVWSPDGRMIALSTDTALIFFDGASGSLLREAKPKSLVNSLRFSPDGRVLVASHKDHQISFWDPERGTLTARVQTGHQEGAYDICFSPDGRTLATVVDNVRLWNVATRQEVASLGGHNTRIFAALFSPNGNHLVTADYVGMVRVWSALPFEKTDAVRK